VVVWTGLTRLGTAAARLYRGGSHRGSTIALKDQPPSSSFTLILHSHSCLKRRFAFIQISPQYHDFTMSNGICRRFQGSRDMGHTGRRNKRGRFYAPRPLLIAIVVSTCILRGVSIPGGRKGERGHQSRPDALFLIPNGCARAGVDITRLEQTGRAAGNG